jgi:hypothetical protein
MSLDRIQVDMNYGPENCRWATRIEQANNRSTNRILTVRGEQMTMKQAAERFGINYSTFFRRLERGWRIERAIKPRAKKSRVARLAPKRNRIERVGDSHGLQSIPNTQIPVA